MHVRLVSVTQGEREAQVPFKKLLEIHIIKDIRKIT